jgi:transposase-like protein
VTDWSIRQWIKKFRQSGELPPDGTVVPQAEEFWALKKENQRLRLENEIF